jgi:transcriptional regulator with XRE-family HTH domain
MAPEAPVGCGEALTVLRLIRGWNQRRLADAARLSESAISLYEAGQRPAPVSRLLAAMGFPPHALDRTLSFLRSARAAHAANQLPETATGPAAIDLFAYDVGLWLEQVIRAGLTCATAASSSAPSPAAEAPSGKAPAGAPQIERSEDGSSQPAEAVQAALLGRALMILRLVAQRSRADLAAAVEIPEPKLARWEGGKGRRPSANVLDRLVAAMELPATFLDRTLAFVASIDPQWSGEPIDRRHSAATEIGALAAREAGAAEDATRALLSRLAAAARHLASRAQAFALWARLAACSPAGQLDLVREAAEFQTAGLCELLCEESRIAARDSAARARHLAALAVLAAERIVGDEAWCSRVRGYAGAHLGNAARAGGGDLPEAERLFAAAEKLWTLGNDSDPGRLLNEARILHLKASLRRAQRRMPEALELLDRALAIDRWGETPTLLVSKAKAMEQLGRYEEAIGLLQQADAAIDAAEEPLTKFLVRLSLSANLCQLARYGEAELLLVEVLPSARRLGNRLDLLRVAWQQGRVAAGLGRAEEAIATLDKVRTAFEAQGNAYDAALVTVELAEVYALLGRTAEVKAMARKSAPVFEAQGVHEEARRALALFRRAAEEERLSGKLLRGLIAYLYRARHDPQLAYEAAG